MARLPIDIMTAGDRKVAPVGPESYQVKTATPDAFGAGIGDALSRMGAVGQQIAGTLIAADKKVREFDLETKWNQFTEKENLSYAERQRGISGTGEGFSTAERQRTEGEVNAWIGANVPPEKQAEFRERGSRYVAGRATKAFVAEWQQKEADAKLKVAEERRKAGVDVQEAPETYEERMKRADEYIDKSPLSDIEKREAKQLVRQEAALEAEKAKIDRNPGAYVGGDAEQAYRDRVRVKESGGNDAAKASTSSATGRYQFIESTWNGIARRIGLPLVTPENRNTADDPRRNGNLQERAMDVYTSDSKAALSRANLPITARNLYVLHFGGAEGGTRLLRAEQTSPGDAAVNHADPAAVAANPTIFFSNANTERRQARSVSEVLAVLGKGLDGNTRAIPRSASGDALSASQRAKLSEIADNMYRSNIQQADAAQTAQLNAARNQLYVDLKEGLAPEETLRAARQSGLLSKYDDIVKAEKIVKDRRDENADFEHGLSLFKAGPETANPFDSKDRKGVDAFYEQSVKNGADPLTTGLQTVERTNMIPKQFATALRGAMVSNDTARKAAAYEVLGQLASKPNLGASIEGGDKLMAEGLDFLRLKETYGTADAAIAEMKRRADAVKNPLSLEERKEVAKKYLSEEKVTANLSRNAWFGKDGALVGGILASYAPARVAVHSDYRDFFMERYEDTRDEASANEYANKKMGEIYGVQNGVMTKFAPSKLPGMELEGIGTKWINEQAAKEVEKLGYKVKPEQIILMPVPGGKTATAFRSPQKPEFTREDGTKFNGVPYQIVIVPEKGNVDQRVIDLPGMTFVPDQKAYVDAANKRANEQLNAPRGTYIDQFGMEVDVPVTANPKILETSEQLQRRKAKELAAAQDAERAKLIDDRKAIKDTAEQMRAAEQQRRETQGANWRQK